MTTEEAHRLLLFDIEEEQGTFLQLRLGNDPGNEPMLRLRVALRVLWRHWKAHAALPYDIARAAGTILHFRGEALQNVNASGQAVRERLVNFELPDLVQGAFDLLAGSEAESWVIRRPDLGE